MRFPRRLLTFWPWNWDGPTDPEVVQTNIVSHTKADGFSRLARQAEFAGTIEPDQDYFLVDDFIGQGGTLANLRGWVLRHGGRVRGATVLTVKPYSARLCIESKFKPCRTRLASCLQRGHAWRTQIVNDNAAGDELTQQTVPCLDLNGKRIL